MPIQPTPPRVAALALLGCALWTLAAQAGCGHPAKAEKVEVFTRVDKRLVVPEGSPLRRTLVTQVAQETEIRSSLTVPASIEADPSDLVKILPPVSGRVVQLHVHLGDWVTKGQPLVTLESADLAQAFADLQKATAQHQLARRSLDRVQELGRHDIASRKDVEQAEADFATNESEWKRARAHVIQLGADTEILAGLRAGERLAVKEGVVFND